jgi:hypothetical protein
MSSPTDHFPLFDKIKEMLVSLTTPSPPAASPTSGRSNGEEGAVLTPVVAAERVERRLAEGDVLDQLLLAEETSSTEVPADRVPSATHVDAYERLLAADTAASQPTAADGHHLDVLMRNEELDQLKLIEMEVVIA